MQEYDDMGLEEGELSNDEVYIPLQRPSTYTTSVQPDPTLNGPPEEDEDEDRYKSSSDSDSDDNVNKSKRTKLLPCVKPLPKKPTRKTNNIWCNTAQEDVLLETLVNCDVSNIDRTRSVETYITRPSSKRTFDDRGNNSLRPRKRKDLKQYYNRGTDPRDILDLNCTSNDSEEVIAKDIANKLCEEKESLILSVVTVAGKEKAMALYKETQQIEAEGGLRILNNSRRRTPGGIFFFLVKNDTDLTAEQQTDIFTDDRIQYKLEERKRVKAKWQKVKAKCKAEVPRNLLKLSSRMELELESHMKNEKVELDEKSSLDELANEDMEHKVVEEIKNINGSDKNVENNVDDCLDIGVDSYNILC